MIDTSKLRIPYVVTWSSEDETVLRYCPYAKEVAAFTNGRQGRGKPVWGELHPERQRRAMWLLHCQVCDASLEMSEARLVIWDGIQTDVFRRPLVMEPWLCEECCRYSIAVCPGLAERPNRRVLIGPKVEMVAATVILPDDREAVSYIKALVIG